MRAKSLLSDGHGIFKMVLKSHARQCVCICLRHLLVAVIPFSMREHLANARETIDGREHMVNHLEEQFSTLEKTMLNMQLRINKLFQQ